MIWVNVGCGPHRAPAPWWNVDRVVRPGNTEPDEVVGDQLPYKHGTVERLYAGHVLEHIVIERVPTTLANWYQILRPGGELAVVGPDVNRALEWYRTGRLSLDELWERMEHGTTTATEAWRRLYGTSNVDAHARHHWNCIPERVIALLEVSEFTDVREVSLNELTDWPLVSRSEDQFAVRAQKKGSARASDTS